MVGQPGKEPRQGDSVAVMGGPHAVELNVILDGLGQLAGIILLDRLGPGPVQPVGDP